MKKIYRVAFLFFLLVSLAMPVKTVAQDDLAAFLSAGEDASKLIEAYTQADGEKCFVWNDQAAGTQPLRLINLLGLI
jgi:hypothetical protein